MSEQNWNERYVTGELPWDTREPDPHLVDLVRAGTIQPGRTLEIGSGTGTNALWLAAQGFEVTALDLSSYGDVAVECRPLGQSSTSNPSSSSRHATWQSMEIPTWLHHGAATPSMVL